MAKKSQRQALIETILNKNGDNDNQQEIAFLESLSLAELSRLADDDDEDEFCVDGETTDYDFDDDEL